MMTQKIGIGRAHSKIILIGEHSVVYGYSAIALPLKNIEVVCQVQASDQALEIDISDPLSTAVFAALEFLDKSDEKISVEIESNVPAKRGMGSSAAVAIAAIRAVFDYFDQSLSLPDLEMLANQAEIIAHENPSGLDAKTCLSDTAIKFIRNLGFSEMAMDLGAYLVIADTGIHGHTREAVSKVRSLEEKALPYLHRLGNLASTIEIGLLAKDLLVVGQAMNRAHDELNHLGVSSPEANHLVQVAKNQGALGAKMSGGGLGGCIIALCQNQEQAESLVSALEKEGAVNTWIENL
ncbi:mevalonate kinase [Streptococcus sobrinus]|uniref:Mevalonate kinase n=1 Tax=Streptococcus sobrinus TaxID=1310 RepID=A0ABN5LM08_9STRE|nr:mevalonate kinase [Streptococcus sobrinus]AWN20830.1 mevalonate kinase [Streptococcus sobrinus]OZV23628.1 mevalonate kinase [Streptococcus sobrinus]